MLATTEERVTAQSLTSYRYRRLIWAIGVSESLSTQLTALLLTTWLMATKNKHHRTKN